LFADPCEHGGQTESGLYYPELTVKIDPFSPALAAGS
jgi:hypothetical protein